MPVFIAEFFEKNGVKLIGGIAIAVGLVLALLSLVNAMKSWQNDVYVRGYSEGKHITEVAYQTASAKNAQEAAKRMADQVDASNASVKVYLDDLSSRQPEIQRVKERTVVYANSPAGNVTCLDHNGVGLWQASRSAAGIDTTPVPHR